MANETKGGWSFRGRTATLLAFAAAFVVGAWLARRFARFEVSGASMEPAFRGGDCLIIDRSVFKARRPRVGEVVVVRDPELAVQWLVKRVWRVAGDGQLDVRGDNAAESRDSRDFGLVPASRVEGLVRWRYWRMQRR